MPRRPRVGDAHAHAHAHRHRAGFCSQVAQAAHRFTQHAKAGLGAVRAGLAEAADAQHDELRVGRMQRVPAQAPGLQSAGLEVFDQHVGLCGQCAHCRLAFGAAQVQRHEALIARLHFPAHAGAFARQPPLTQRVATIDRLNLDDVGAKVGQRLAGERAGNQLAHFQHFQALKRIHLRAFLRCESQGLPRGSSAAGSVAPRTGCWLVNWPSCRPAPRAGCSRR